MNIDQEITPAQAQSIGIVASASSTSALAVDLHQSQGARSVNGRMVLVAPRDADNLEEYGLGTVAEVANWNPQLEKAEIRAVVASRGRIGNLVGTDVKTAKVDMQAVFRRRGNILNPIGGSLSFVPDTGEQVYVVDSDVVETLASNVTDDLFYIGTLYRQPDIPMPMTVADFSGSRGSTMAGFFGPSGAGKTHLATQYTACQMRHKRMAFLLIDPQGQFCSTAKVRRELPLDLRALADAQGREVRQLSVAFSVRMPKDEKLLVDLLDSAKFFGATNLLAASNKKDEAKALTEGWLRAGAGGWHDHDPDTVLESLLNHLVDNATSIMASEASRSAFIERLRQVLDDPDGAGSARKQALLRVFGSFHNLFAANAPNGAVRTPMSGIVKDLCDSHVSVGNARPFYLLTMTDRRIGERGDSDMVSRALEDTRTQTVVLRTLFGALEGEAQWLYQSEDRDPANLMVVLDEAARFTSDSSRGKAESREFAEDMARYFREIRKYAVGFTLILQEPSIMHDSIWKQLRNGFRAFAGGMVGNDMEKVREQIGSGEAMKLYTQLAQPSQNNPIYPWMVCGPASPLNATNNPMFLEAFNSPEKWQRANRRWVEGTFNVSDLWNGQPG